MKKKKGAKVTYVVFAFVIFALICNVVYIGVTGKHFVSGNDIAAFSKKRGTRKDTEYASRGQIYSSDGEVIAANVKKYRLVAILSSNRPGYGNEVAHVEDYHETAKQIAPIIGMDPVAMEAKMQENSDKYQIEFGSYGSNLSAIVKEKIEATNLPGLEFIEQDSRNYPMGDFASYIVGYAQNVEEDNIQHVVGKMGFELVYNKELSGKNGYKLYQVDSKQYVLPNGLLEEEKAQDGSDIYLTINSGLQRDLDIQIKKTAQETGADKATAAIMEAKTGKILAISNYPSFDPNSRDIEDYNDFFIDTPFECGSVFKPFVYSNVIDDGNYNGNATYTSGTYEISGETLRDWNKGEGKGVLTYDQGLAWSSNVAICNLIANYANRESLINDYQKLGFFQESKVDGLSSAAGIAGFEKTDRLLEFMTTGFGQGSTVTGLQLLRAYSVFANNGKTVEPYLVDRMINSQTNEVTYKGKSNYSEQIFETTTIDKMKQLLYNNIYDETYSVAKWYRPDNVQIMGKTGTGQIARSDGYKGYRTDIYSKSFAGIAPYDDPEIIIYAMFQCKDTTETSQMIGNFVKTMVPAALATKNAYTNTDSNIEGSAYRMDSFINQSASFVKSKLESKELKVDIVGNGSTVLDQYPASKTAVNKSDRVFLKTDSSDITLPDMIGWSRKDVLTYASLSGIVFNLQGETGLVESQSIGGGTIVHAGDTVEIVLK